MARNHDSVPRSSKGNFHFNRFASDIIAHVEHPSLAYDGGGRYNRFSLGFLAGDDRSCESFRFEGNWR